ncbi:MAG: MDR family MFS transporter [Dehalococcoidia bacterium]
MGAPSSPARPLGETLDSRQKLLLVISLQMALFVSALNQSVVATAIPRILADLNGYQLLSWVFTVYMVASTVVVLPVGRLSDMFGRKHFILAGVATFMIGSAACGFSQSMPQLITARAIQGVGGGIIFASVFAVLGDLFPPAERAKYMGLFTGTFTLASFIGPTVGGGLTDHVGWRWCFYLSVPVALAALAFIARNLPEPAKKGGRLGDIDLVGSGLLSGATVSLLLGLSWSGKEFGWGSAETLGLFATAIAFTIAFGFQERRHKAPVFPLGLFRNREFVLANVAVMLVGAGGFGAIQYLPTFMQISLKASATASGAVTTPQSLGLLATSIIGGQILARTGRYRKQLLFGGALILCGTLLVRTLDTGEPIWHIAVFMLIYGFGTGLVMPTMGVVVQNAVPHSLLGVATSARQFFMQMGNVLGVAIFGVILANSYGSTFSENAPPELEQQLSAEVYAEFDDPTISLDARRFAPVQEAVLDLPDGEILLAATLATQRDAMKVAIHHIFLGSALLAAAAMVLVFLMKEIPLRRTFDSSSPAAPERTPDTTAPASGRLRVPVFRRTRS